MSRLSLHLWSACAGPAALMAPPPTMAAPATAPTATAAPPSAAAVAAPRIAVAPPTAAPAAIHAAAGPAAPPAAADAPRPRRPTHPAEAHLRAGRDAAAQGDLLQAIAAFDRALTHDPALTLAHLCRSLCLLDLDRDHEAAASLHHALATAPKEPHARLDLARFCARAGLSPIALHLLPAALRDSPGLVDHARTDPAFTTLHDHPTYLQITGQL